MRTYWGMAGDPFSTASFNSSALTSFRTASLTPPTSSNPADTSTCSFDGGNSVIKLRDCLAFRITGKALSWCFYFASTWLSAFYWKRIYLKSRPSEWTLNRTNHCMPMRLCIMYCRDNLNMNEPSSNLCCSYSRTYGRALYRRMQLKSTFLIASWHQCSLCWLRNALN